MLAAGASTYLWVLYTSTRYDWNSTRIGVSLTLLGIVVSLVQGGLAGRIAAALGNRGSVYLGAVHGALNSITSLADVFAPPLWTFLFSWSIAPARSVHVPGLAYYVASAVSLLAALVAKVGFQRTSPTR